MQQNKTNKRQEDLPDSVEDDTPAPENSPHASLGMFRGLLYALPLALLFWLLLILAALALLHRL